MEADAAAQPEVLDLGALDGPVLVFGGPYGNLEATRALRRAARRLRVPAERTICTGDVVAYAADPQATVDLLREWACPVLMGNCEEYADGLSSGLWPSCDILPPAECAARGRPIEPASRLWAGPTPLTRARSAR
jgi:hypothetical protein